MNVPLRIAVLSGLIPWCLLSARNAVVALLLLHSAAPAMALVVRPGIDAQARLREALALIQPGETVRMAAGVFRLEESLTVAVESSILQGAGPNRTILLMDFATSASGGLLVQANGVELRGFSVQNAPGAAIRVADCTDILLKDVRLRWASDDTAEAGPRNGLEILRSQDLLLEGIRVEGATANGVLIEDSSRVLLRDSHLSENATGLHLRDSDHIDVSGSSVQFNGIGIRANRLERMRIFSNLVAHNNNFATGRSEPSPRGAGVIISGGRDIALFGNRIGDHGSFNVLIRASGEDKFPERIRIYDNRFGHAGHAPDIANVNDMLQAGGGRLASIVWDGEVPWQEMLGLRETQQRVVFGRNSGEDFVNLDMPWFRLARAIHTAVRDYDSYLGTLAPLPEVLLISQKVRSMAREHELPSD